MGLVVPLERMLEAPEAFLPAFEALLDDKDPWVRALARLAARQDADHGLDKADRTRTHISRRRSPSSGAIGERYGISFALTELAERIATRGEFAACVRALRRGDRGRHRGRCHRGCHPDAVATGPAVLAAGRRGLQRGRHGRGANDARNGSPGRMHWPNSPSANAELARWGGDAEEAYLQIGVATTMLGGEAEPENIRAVTHDLLGYLADDVNEARRAPSRGMSGGVRGRARTRPPRRVLVGVADLALRTRPVRAGRAVTRRPARRCADCRIVPTRTWRGSSRSRGAASARHGSPKQPETARRRTGPSWSA